MRAPVLWVGILLMGVFFGVARYRGYGTPYAPGRDIRDLGVTAHDSRATWKWATSAREPIRAYLRRHGVDLAHFTGSIVLCRPGEPRDGFALPFLDGKLAHHHDSLLYDARLDRDLETLRSTHLRTMMETTRNDWRIMNDRGHFIDPDGKPFTGALTVASHESMAGYVEMQVEGNRIVRTARGMFYPGLD